MNDGTFPLASNRCLCNAGKFFVSVLSNSEIEAAFTLIFEALLVNLRSGVGIITVAIYVLVDV